MNKRPTLEMTPRLTVCIAPIMTPQLRRRREDRPDDEATAKRAPWREKRARSTPPA